MTNQATTPNYTELLPALRRAVAAATDDAAWRMQQPLEKRETDADREAEVFGDLWLELLRVVLKHRDCSGRELGRLVAEVVKAQAGVDLVPVVGAVVGRRKGGGLVVDWDDADAGRNSLF